MNSSSDFTISSDWDVIDEEMSQLVPDGKKSEEATSEELKETDNIQKGSCVDDIPEPEITDSQEDSCVPDIKESEINNHPESSSSSEFDVLDESVEDNQSNLSFPHMEYSISSSLGDNNHPSLIPETEEPEDIEREANPREETPSQSRSYRGSRNPYPNDLSLHPYMLAAVVSFMLIAVLIACLPFGSLERMKDHMRALQTENDELKSLVQSKLENDKLLMALEEQIKSLKDENFKLSESMKALLAQLEQQTAILKKDKEAVQDPYRSEIEKLKEQINILQIDNEELQKQLVRTRYGIYSPHPKDSTTVEEKEEQKDKADNKENRDNSSEILVEEINELRKKLYTEVEKLKSWKDSVQHLVKKLGKENAGSSAENEKRNEKSSAENEKQSFKDKESFDDSTSNKGDKKSKHGKKDTKYSDWSWRGVKKNLKDTFEALQDIDVPNMFSNYVDKKKIEVVFDSVGHYIKKAQEKTKKVLNFNNDVHQEMGHFFQQLKNQWNDISNKYYKTAKQAPGDIKPQFSKRKVDIRDFEEEEKFDRYQKQKKPKVKHDHNMPPDVESFPTPPTTEIPYAEKTRMAPEDKEMNEDNSWVFKRAAHRSQLREEEQEAFTNWFLKRGRDFHYNEDESLKEWIRETYHNGNSDED